MGTAAKVAGTLALTLVLGAAGYVAADAYDMVRPSRVTRGFAAVAACARRGRTAFASRATCGFAARQGLSSGTTTSPFRDHTPA